MGMGFYRDSDVPGFSFLSAVGNIFVVTAFCLIVLYHFYDPRIAYRDLALLVLLISVLLRWELVIKKVEILEKRLASILHKDLPGGRGSASTSNLVLLFYFLLFWATLIFVVIAFLPANWRQMGFFR